jgi:TetR/AcrR family transcriptional repressor of nem operon
MSAARDKRPVGRPREFDEDSVLEAAMEVFWRKGYEATSLADLCSCTGLHKGSLYQTFGSKHDLFMTALKHYIDRQFAEVGKAADSKDSPLANLRSAMRALICTVSDDWGCLMVNSLVELAPHDPAVRELLQASAERRMGRMAALVGAAQAAGELRRDQPPEAIAMQLMVTLAGLAATLKGFLTESQALSTVDNVLATLA